MKLCLNVDLNENFCYIWDVWMAERNAAKPSGFFFNKLSATINLEHSSLCLTIITDVQPLYCDSKVLKTKNL